MKRDLHTGEDGLYTVRSIYFDNADDKALREKIYGVQKRGKISDPLLQRRPLVIALEKKIKYNDLCMKLDAQLNRDEYLALLSGETEWMRSHPLELVRELYCKLKYQQLRPRVMVLLSARAVCLPSGECPA